MRSLWNNATEALIVPRRRAMEEDGMDGHRKEGQGLSLVGGEETSLGDGCRYLGTRDDPDEGRTGTSETFSWTHQCWRGSSGRVNCLEDRRRSACDLLAANLRFSRWNLWKLAQNVRFWTGFSGSWFCVMDGFYHSNNLTVTKLRTFRVNAN